MHGWMMFTWSLASLFWVSSRRQRPKMCWWETRPAWLTANESDPNQTNDRKHSVQKLNANMRVTEILESYWAIKDISWSFRIYLRKKERKKKRKEKKTIIHSPLLYSMEYKLWYVQMIVKGIGYTSPISTEDHVTVKLVFVCHSQNMIIVTCIWVYNSHFTGQLLFRTGCVRDAEITRPALPELQFFKYIFI